MPETSFTGFFVPTKLTMQSTLVTVIDDFYDLPGGWLSSGAMLKFLPLGWQLFWASDCYMNLSVDASVPGPVRKPVESGDVSQTFSQLVGNNFNCPNDPVQASLDSGKRGWTVSWPDGSNIHFSPVPSVPGPTLKGAQPTSLPNDGIGVLGQVKLLGKLDNFAATPPDEGSYLAVGDQAGSGARVGITARYVGFVVAGETAKSQIFVDPNGDIYVQQTVGPNAGKRVDITKGAWK